MFNETSKYSSIFNNTPPTSYVAHGASDFLACYSCLYYSFQHIVYISLKNLILKCQIYALFYSKKDNLRL